MWIPRLHSLCEKNTSRLRCFLLLTSLSLAVMTLWAVYVTRWRFPTTLLSLTTRRERWTLRAVCKDTLTNMVRGRWQQHHMTSTQRFELKLFHMKVRFQRFPTTNNNVMSFEFDLKLFHMKVRFQRFPTANKNVMSFEFDLKLFHMKVRSHGILTTTKKRREL